ncbi:aspartate/methionine/tyrosine aminotransferase [Halanaerobium saccharolyticum]|uniref:Aminotransferase n=1 Tax=Halanaerobium saccharolyticum TaxID=43595 RepID=A0A4R7YWH4_9FIRM|nr:aminotransferase class I/II-fold pyridoxal phosphate-dependent enzyme [Halanaerobium saccharolyticum]RAK06920.1 aspartate/methionine/tyrosine aminotransferase [Halanaerobium saccharolyticum]TDW01647.1 aspartate/methionine/tyrosine aminotransferase [Halanaerobium saccharolyticum]TDX53045.1 aspartate/methionine/tyrosine aminotransferase [Halanaerobium saccharolyticum]
MSNRYLSSIFKKEKKSFFAKAAELKESKKHIIDLSLGDPDLITAKEIINKATFDAKNGHTRYAHPRGDYELRTEIIKYYKKTYDQKIAREKIMLTVGACHGTFLALAAVLNPGEEVIIPSPYFAPYKEQVKLVGGQAVFVESKFEDNFKLDLKAINEAVNKKTKAILINSPHNPTGVVQSKEILDQLMEIARANDLLIFSDEVYESFDFENKFHSLINYKEDFERIIILNSFSKTFAMTGWRLGFVIADSDILDVMQNINEGVCYSAPTISQRAATAALKNENKFKTEITVEFSERVKYANHRLKENKIIEVVEAEGAFYIFPRIKNTGLTAEEFALRLLKEKEVLVLPGNDFGDKKGEFIRIACTLKLEELKKAFDRIDEFTEQFF